MRWKMDSKDQVPHLNWNLFLFESIITTEPFMPWSDPLSQFNTQENLQAQAVCLTYQRLLLQHSWTPYRVKN